MRFPILCSVILFVIALTIAIKRSDRKIEQETEAYFEKEARANSVRKKSLEHLAYITIPAAILNLSAETIKRNCPALAADNSEDEPEDIAEDKSEEPEDNPVDKSEDSEDEPEDSLEDKLADKSEDNSKDKLMTACRDLEKNISFLHELSERKIVNFTGISNTDLKLAYGTANITILTEFDQNYTLLARELQSTAENLLLLGDTEDARIVLEFAISTRTDVSGSYRDLAQIYKEAKEPEKIDSLIASAKEVNSIMSSSIVHTLEEIRDIPD